MKLLPFNVLVALLFLLVPSIQAMPSPSEASVNLGDPSLAQLIESVGLSANKQISNILSQQVPRLSYTGIAFVAGITGIFISNNGLNRLCKGIDEDQNKTIITGAAQLTAGLSTVAASIAAIYLLWKKRHVI